MSDSTPKPLSRWMLGSFLLYFAAFLPAIAWALHGLIQKNTFPEIEPAVLAAVRTIVERNALLAEAPTRLILDQDELLLAVILAGAIGSYIHSVNSFVTYVGNRRFVQSWTPWYVLRPFVGVAMALVFYVVIRGGVLVLSGGESQVDPYAIMTVAALAGMFSKQASDKLAEVFDTMFRSAGDAERADKLTPTTPKLSAVEPPSVAVGAGDIIVKVRGEGFVASSVIAFDGVERASTFTNTTELAFQLQAAELVSPGEHTVTVSNPEGGVSNELKLTVTAAGMSQPEKEDDGGAGQATIPLEKVVKMSEDGLPEVVSEAVASATHAIESTPSAPITSGDTAEPEAGSTTSSTLPVTSELAEGALTALADANHTVEDLGAVGRAGSADQSAL